MDLATLTEEQTTQLVVFETGESQYALPVTEIGEVLRMVAISPVPEAPAWMPGVVNLRGKVIPVLDLRLRLGMPPCEYTLSTPIVVAQTEGRTVGIVVDSVRDFITVPNGSIEPRADGAVSAVARVEDRLILILDLANVAAGLGQA